MVVPFAPCGNHKNCRFIFPIDLSYSLSRCVWRCGNVIFNVPLICFNICLCVFMFIWSVSLLYWLICLFVHVFFFIFIIFHYYKSIERKPQVIFSFFIFAAINLMFLIVSMVSSNSLIIFNFWHFLFVSYHILDHFVLL